MFANGVRETSSTTGTGTLTLAAVTGYPRFANAFADGQQVSYAIVDANGLPLEFGIGRYVASNTLTRDKVLANAGSSSYDDTSPAAVSLTGTNTIIATPVAGTFAGAAPSVDSVSPAGNRVTWSACMEYSGTANGKTLGSDVCFYMPFLLEVGGEFDAFVINVSSAVSGNVRCGLYQCTPTGYMGTKLIESADIATTTTGIKTGTFTSRFLNPGWYFTAIAAKGITPQVSAYNAGSARNITRPTPLGVDSSLAPYNWRDETLSGGWTNLPSSASVSTSGRTVTADYAPMVLLRSA